MDQPTDFSNVAPPVSGIRTTSVNTTSLPGPVGPFLPEAYINSTRPYYQVAGSGGGGGGVESVSGTAGQINVANGTTNAVISLPAVGTVGAKSNISSITTDAQGRVTATTSLAYTPANPANFVPTTGGTFTGEVSGIAPTVDANFATKKYVDDQIIAGGGVQSVTAGDSSITIAGTLPNPTVAVANQAGVTAGAYTNANVTVNDKGIITAVTNGSAPGDVSQWATFPAVQDVDMAGHNIKSVGEQLDITAGEINLVQATALGASPGYTFPFPTVMNLTASGAIGISAGGAVGVNAGGAVEIGAVGTIQILSTGNVSIGSGNVLGADTEIEKVAFSDNLIYKVAGNDDIVITDVNTINTVQFSSTGDIDTTGDITTTGYVGANILKLANEAPLPAEIADFQIGTDHVISLTNSTVPLADKPALLDTVFNAPTMSINAPNLTLNAKKNDGTAVQLSSVDLSSVVPASGFSSFPNVIERVSASTVTLDATTVSTVYSFRCTSGASGIIVNLPAGPVANGSQIFIQNMDNSTGPLTVGPNGMEIEPGGGCYCVANNASGALEWAVSDSLFYKKLNALYVPLAGTAPGNPMTGTLQVADTTNIESKNITTALITPLPSVGYVSVLGPTQVENGNFGIFNPAGSEIGMASSANPAPGEVATIAYNHAVDDNIHINKRIEAPNMTLGSTDVLPVITFKDARTFYVSKQGSDSNSGSILEPFLTVQQAITSALATGSESVVSVGPGTFTENLTINSVAGIVIKGSLASDRLIEGTILKGVISIQVSGVDNMNNNQVVISDCSVMGHIHDTSSKQHTLIVQNCRIEANSANGGKAVEVAMTATDGRTFVQDCVITQEAGTTGVSSVISANVGWLNVFECDVSVRANGCAVSVSGSAWISRLSQCAISSSSSSASPNALVFVNSTSSLPHSISLTSLLFDVATTKTTPAILATRPSVGVITLALAECLFGVAGTGVNDNAVQFGAGTTLVCLVANNRSLNTVAGAYSYKIQSGATVLPLTQVGETSVSTVNSASGALTVAGGTGVTVSTVGNTITVNATNNGTVTGVGAGTGIAVNNTNPAVPVISNTGVTQLIAGTNISLTAETGSITISASGGGGGGGAVDSVSAGTGITLTGTAQDVIVNNAGVLSVGVGTGLVNTGTASDPVIAISGTGTITTQAVNTGDLTTTGTVQFNGGVLPRVSAIPPTPTQPNELVPLQYVNSISTGVQSITAGDSSISIGGTPSDPTVSVSASGVTAGTYDYATVEVGTDGRVISASSGTQPVLSVSGTTDQITVGGTSTNPSVGLAVFGGGEATHPYPSSIAVDDYGRVISVVDGSAPVITTVNGNSGTVTIAGGTNVTIDDTVPGTITINASGGGGGGITSINSQTGSAITLSGSGYIQVSNPTPDTINFYTSGQIDQIQAGLGISVNNGDPVYPTITANVAGIQAGTGITVSPLQNNVFEISASGGGGGVASIVPGLGIAVDATDPANPIVSNTSTITAGNTTMTVLDDGIGNYTLTSNPGGSVVSNLEFAGTYNAQNVLSLTATNITASSAVQASAGFNGFKATGGTSQTYALVHADASSPSELGLKRCKLNQSNGVVAGTTGFIYDQYYNQTVTVPFATSGPSFVAPIGTTINNSLTKIISQIIQPNSTAWNFLNARTWGILGNITLITASARPMRFTITYQKNGGTERTMAATYIQNNAYMTVPVNNISIGLPDNTLSANDALTINIYAQTIVSLDTTTIATAVPFISAVLSPLSTN